MQNAKRRRLNYQDTHTWSTSRSRTPPPRTHPTQLMNSFQHHPYPFNYDYYPPPPPFYPMRGEPMYSSIHRPPDMIPFDKSVIQPPPSMPPPQVRFQQQRMMEQMGQIDYSQFLQENAQFQHRNDYSQHYVDTGFRPQNYIRDADYKTGFDDYPRLKELISMKDKLVNERATPPMFIKCDLKKFNLKSLGTKFDVILVDPPWEEYARRAPGMSDDYWTVEEIGKLQIGAIAENPSFLFFWVGSKEGLQEGRKILKKWGFRRCEDICWIKTNRDKDRRIYSLSDDESVFEQTKEHCLMGIKGTVRRSQDGHIINANIDTDLMVTEEYPYGSTRKPEELYSIIEHFALGRRRIELFGGIHNIRRGWVTLGLEIPFTNYDATKYLEYFKGENGHLLGTTEEIEQARPKSPIQIAQQKKKQVAQKKRKSPPFTKK